MERVKDITEFVVISNLENRALNAGINKAQQWWKNRHNTDDKEPNKPVAVAQPQRVASASVAAMPIGESPGQLLITILRGQDLYESRLAAFTGASSSNDRPYVTLECNQQRFQTAQAESSSTKRQPEWRINNGPFGFNIFNPNQDRLTIWIQQQDPLKIIKGNESKLLGTCEVHVNQLIGQQQVWLPLRKDNRPVGQILIQINYIPKYDLPPAYEGLN